MKFCNSGHCTCFWDKFFKWDLVPCCKLHDYNYEKKKISRKKADYRFLKCLKARTSILLALPMWAGVRVFGWYFWKKEKRINMGKNVSNAILIEDELLAHFGEQTEDGEYVNHYLYDKRDDGTLTAWMCCDFEVIGDKGEVLFRGGCGEGVCYDLEKHNITLEKGN